MRLKTFVLSMLFSMVTFIIVTFIFISYKHNSVNQFGLKDNVKRINVTSIAPFDLNSRVYTVESINNVFNQTTTTIIYVPFDSNGIEIMLFNKEISDVFKNVSSNEDDFFLVSRNAFFSRNLNLYGIDFSRVTGEFDRDNTLNYDFIANYENFGTTVEGEYYVETDCIECLDQLSNVFPPSNYQVSAVEVNRSLVNIILSNTAVNLLLISYVIVVLVFFMLINHNLTLDKHRFTINKLYGGGNRAITTMYLRNLLSVEVAAVFLTGLITIPILLALFKSSDLAIVLGYGNVVSLAILSFVTMTSVYFNVRNGGRSKWK